MDVGVLPVEGELRTALVEINDGICLGNYGLDSKHYAQMIAARWQELIGIGWQRAEAGKCFAETPSASKRRKA